MARYTDLLATVLGGRQLTREVATTSDDDLPPMENEPEQEQIDAEQARIFLEAAKAQREAGGKTR